MSQVWLLHIMGVNTLGGMMCSIDVCLAVAWSSMSQVWLLHLMGLNTLGGMMCSFDPFVWQWCGAA